MFWLVVLGFVVTALVAAALIDLRFKRLGITIDAQSLHERRKEHSRAVRRSLLPRVRPVGSTDREEEAASDADRLRH